MTDSTLKYCTHCGSPLRAGIRFCGQCGQPVQPAPAAPASAAPPAPVASAPQASNGYAPAAGESIVGIIPAVQRRKGFLGMGADTFNLILTPGRLVFALVTPQMMRDAVAAARENAKGQGKGFFGQIAAQMAWVDVVCQQYMAMPVDAILARYPGSFFIANAQVKKVRVKESVVDDEGSTSNPELIVETTGGKHRFVLSGMPARDARHLLKQMFGNAVR